MFRDTETCPTPQTSTHHSPNVPPLLSTLTNAKHQMIILVTNFLLIRKPSANAIARNYVRGERLALGSRATKHVVQRMWNYNGPGR